MEQEKNNNPRAENPEEFLDIKLGKPKGTIQKSKFDKDVEKIKELLGYGLSIRKMAKVLGYTSHIALNTYINKRTLR
jgi:hypothetical protein